MNNMENPSKNVIDTITDMMNNELLLHKMKSGDESFFMTNDDKFSIIEANFRGNQKSERLVRHQKESYNDLTSVRIPKTIEMFNPVVIRSENDYVPEMDKYTLDTVVNSFPMLRNYIYTNNDSEELYKKTILENEDYVWYNELSIISKNICHGI